MSSLPLAHSTPIPFELHITTSLLPDHAIPAFQSFCAEQQAKPLLIQLDRGTFIEQPMFNKVVHCLSLPEALQIAHTVAVAMEAKGWSTRRLKIEIPAYLAGNWHPDGSCHPPYFEWHGKIDTAVTEQLRALCSLHKVHLSINALKKDTQIRFITLREYGSTAIFQQRVTQLKEALAVADILLVKDIAEYCVYDNNDHLDHGWLPQ